MSLTLDDVKRIAYLARIEATEADAAGYLPQLSDIFALVEQMQVVDTGDVAPMAHARDVVQRLRADKVTEGDQHGRFQAVAPQVDAGLYLVPKVIE